MNKLVDIVMPISMYIISISTFMIALAVISEVSASEIEIHGLSHHTNSGDFDFNETNLGLGYNHNIHKNVDLSVGGFINSYDDTSFYLGFTPKYDFCSGSVRCEVGAIAGLVTGYDNEFTDASSVQPLILPQFVIGTDRLNLKMRYIPSIEGNINVFTFSIGVGL